MSDKLQRQIEQALAVLRGQTKPVRHVVVPKRPRPAGKGRWARHARITVECGNCGRVKRVPEHAYDPWDPPACDGCGKSMHAADHGARYDRKDRSGGKGRARRPANPPPFGKRDWSCDLCGKVAAELNQREDIPLQGAAAGRVAMICNKCHREWGGNRGLHANLRQAARERRGGKGRARRGEALRHWHVDVAPLAAPEQLQRATSYNRAAAERYYEQELRERVNVGYHGADERGTGGILREARLTRAGAGSLGVLVTLFECRELYSDCTAGDSEAIIIPGGGVGGKGRAARRCLACGGPTRPWAGLDWCPRCFAAVVTAPGGKLRRPVEGKVGPRGGRTEIQSLLFPRPVWTAAKAKAWAKKHDFKYGDVDVTDNYVRLRQRDPGGFRLHRTIPLGRPHRRTGQLKAVVGIR